MLFYVMCYDFSYFYLAVLNLQKYSVSFDSELQTLPSGSLCRVKAVRHTRIFRPANRSVMPVRRAGSVVGGRKKTRTAFRQWV